jgi:hypothetical protein
MKYTNLLDAVMGQITEGKSYKRNKDEDVDAKQKRDSKKEPVAEDMRPSEVKPAAGSPLAAGGRVSGHTIQPGFMFRVVTGPLSKKDQFCARVKEIEGVKWVYLIDQYGDQDWYKADDVFPTKISLRKADASNRARFTTMAEDYAPVFEEDEDHAGSLEEAYGRGWAILPATVALYGKKVVDITTAASEWASDKYPTTILVCHKSENGRDRTLFLASSGDCRTQYKVGQSSETFHDQTRASKGIYTILNIVVFQGGEVIYKANDQGMTGKASVAVFK